MKNLYPYDTNDFYFGTTRGECLGLDPSPERMTNWDIRPDTDIKNLYMSGHDICTGGFSGALSGGYICALNML